MTEEKPTSDVNEEPQLEELSEKLIPDEKLRSKLADQPDKICELIIEADLPKRQFRFESNKGASPKSLVMPDKDQQGEDREVILSRLSDRLQKLVGKDNVNVIETAGAIVVRLEAKQLSKVLTMEDVKAIRENRKISPIRPAAKN